MTIKKSCKNCRALGGTRCELGFKNQTNINYSWKDPIPLEPCPKPLTYEAYFAEREKRQKELAAEASSE